MLTNYSFFHSRALSWKYTWWLTATHTAKRSVHSQILVLMRYCTFLYTSFHAIIWLHDKMDHYLHWNLNFQILLHDGCKNKILSQKIEDSLGSTARVLFISRQVYIWHIIFSCVITNRPFYPLICTVDNFTSYVIFYVVFRSGPRRGHAEKG